MPYCPTDRISISYLFYGPDSSFLDKRTLACQKHGLFSIYLELGDDNSMVHNANKHTDVVEARFLKGNTSI